MSDWLNVASTDELKPGEVKVVGIDGTDVALFNIAEEYFAVEDLCTHDGAEIASGCIHADVIECPRHGARFSIRTGEVTAPPAYEPLHVFALEVRAEQIFVRDDRWD